MKPLAPLLLALTAGSCMTGPPPHRVDTEAACVYAEEEALARRVAERANEGAAWVREKLPDTRDGRPPIWVVDRIEPFWGFPLKETTNGLRFHFLWIDRLYLAEHAWEESLTHELVHYLIDRIWHRMPAFVEEGLCDWMTVHEPGNPFDERRRALRTLAGIALGTRMRLSVKEPLDDGGSVTQMHTLHYEPPYKQPERLAAESAMDILFGANNERFAAFAVGYAIVAAIEERHGLTKLHELCREASRARNARIPLEQLYEAAGVEDAEELGQRMLADLDEQELEDLCDSMAKPLASYLSEYKEFGEDREALWAWLEEAEVQIFAPGSDVRLRLTREVLEPPEED